jgi:hypothetical protein
VGFLRRFLGEPPEDPVALREAAYQTVFGKYASKHVWEPSPTNACQGIQYYSYPFIEDRPWLTIVTGGMSDDPMQLPASVHGPRARFELVAHAMELSDELARYLRMVALFPRLVGGALFPGCTIRSDEVAFVRGADKVATVLVQALWETEERLPGHLSIGGDPVHLLLPLPITAAEHQYVVTHGVQEFFDGPFGAFGSLLFAPDRPSTL